MIDEDPSGRTGFDRGGKQQGCTSFDAREGNDGAGSPVVKLGANVNILMYTLVLYRVYTCVHTVPCPGRVPHIARQRHFWAAAVLKDRERLGVRYEAGERRHTR
jgi:hypothetical protein